MVRKASLTLRQFLVLLTGLGLLPIVCLSAAVMQAADAVRPAMAAARRRFIESVDEVWVMGDETRLVQVATNLLANALRYGGDSDVRIVVRRNGANALPAVSDLGVGMEPAARR